MNPRHQKILDLVAGHPDGITARELHKHVFCHDDTLRKDLRKLRKAGHIAVSSAGGSKARWATVDRIAEVAEKHRQTMVRVLRAQVDPAARERGLRSAITRKANQAAKAAGIVELPPAAPDKEFLTPRRAVVPAGQWVAEVAKPGFWFPA